MATIFIPIDKLAAKLGESIERTARKAISQLFHDVVYKTPVDVDDGGRARANWNISYGSPNLSWSDDEKDTSRIQGQIEAVATSAKLGGIMYLSNGVPYIGVLEYGGYPNPPKRGSKKRHEKTYTIHVINGYSMQAPVGMMRVTVAQWDSFVTNALK